jgi:hypothetical protein
MHQRGAFDRKQFFSQQTTTNCPLRTLGVSSRLCASLRPSWIQLCCGLRVAQPQCGR